MEEEKGLGREDGKERKGRKRRREGRRDKIRGRGEYKICIIV